MWDCHKVWGRGWREGTPQAPPTGSHQQSHFLSLGLGFLLCEMGVRGGYTAQVLSSLVLCFPPCWQSCLLLPFFLLRSLSWARFLLLISTLGLGQPAPEMD